MKYHHTKNKGDLGVLKAQADLAMQGYGIVIPVTEHGDFDLVAYKDQLFLRIQVKYRKMNKNGVLHIPFKSSWSDSHGVHDRPVDKSGIDLYCVYCPNTDECYYFDPKQFNRSVYLRIRPTKNNQQFGVHHAKDFRRVP